MIQIDISAQKLVLHVDGQSSMEYYISSAANGIGQKNGGHQTPLGRHIICAKIGEGLPFMSVFRGRRWTGEIYTCALAEQYPKRDWILSRVLWLHGQELGLNRGGDQDSRRRMIYIHGTDEEHLIGQPASHGCIRMLNKDIIELFSCVQVGEVVDIGT